MKNEEKIDLAIGICFASGDLSPEQCELIQSLDVVRLEKKHNLNDLQANRVLAWCKVQQQRHLNNELYRSDDQ